MKALVILPLFFLTGCQGTGSHQQQTGAIPAPNSAARSATDICTFSTTGFRAKPSKVTLPGFTNGDFTGVLHYAANRSGEVDLGACPGTENDYGVPVPEGFTPDWFLHVAVVLSPNEFGNGDYTATLHSVTFRPNTNYYLYVYDNSNNLVESSGPYVKTHKNLGFDSPFENGFTITNTTNLELVHPTK